MTSYLTNPRGQFRAVALMTAAIHEDDDRYRELLAEASLDPAATIEGLATLLRIELVGHAKRTGCNSTDLLQLYGRMTALHEAGIEDPPAGWEPGPEK